MSDCDCAIEITDREQRTILWWLLAINGAMFLVEFVSGWLAESTGLIADSLDMLADASVYGISLYAVGRSVRAKSSAASLSGIFQILLAAVVLVDVSRRFIVGSEPVSGLMMGVGAVALAANMICLALIYKQRHGEIHMRASWIFSVNDVLANLGVIIAGLLVLVLGSRLPDLIIGLVISALVFRGGIRILRETRAG
jgi:cation diffusion facilitator family transporter